MVVSYVAAVQADVGDGILIVVDGRDPRGRVRREVPQIDSVFDGARRIADEDDILAVAGDADRYAVAVESEAVRVKGNNLRRATGEIADENIVGVVVVARYQGRTAGENHILAVVADQRRKALGSARLAIFPGRHQRGRACSPVANVDVPD